MPSRATDDAAIEQLLDQRRRATQAARAAFLNSFLALVDPDGELEPEERARRAEVAHSDYMRRLAERSAEARRERRLERLRGAVEQAQISEADIDQPCPCCEVYR